MFEAITPVSIDSKIARLRFAKLTGGGPQDPGMMQHCEDVWPIRGQDRESGTNERAAVS